MDEDEEYLPENSSLNQYLNQLELPDVQIFKDKAETSTNKVSVENDNLVTIDEDVFEIVRKIIFSRLIFEEDLSILKVVLSNYKIGTLTLLKGIFDSLSAVCVIFVGLLLYFVIGYFALILISPFYAYKCANYFIRKKFVNTELKELIKVLRKTTIRLSKAIYFIKELNKNYIIHNNSSLSLDESLTYVRYRSSLHLCLTKMINSLVSSTQKLIKNIPLVDYADTTEYYICVNFENICDETDDPVKMHQVYLLLQSEFLRRLILSLIPSLYKFSDKYIPKKVNKIVRNTCVQLTVQEQQLLKNHNFLCYMKKPKNEEIMPKLTFHEEYMEKLAINIEKISSISQSLLIKWKIQEESNKVNKNVDFFEDNLIVLQNAINDCQRNINNSFILLKKAKSVLDTVDEDKVLNQESLKCSQKNIKGSSNETIDGGESQDEEQEVAEFQREENEEDGNKIKVGYTDFDRIFEDDVFEVYISNENEIGKFNPDDCDLDELSKKKLQRDFSQNVMLELKSKLVEKARNWKEREENIMRKKGLIDDNNEELLNDEISEGQDETGEKKGITKTNCEECCLELKSPPRSSLDFEPFFKSFKSADKNFRKKKKKRKNSNEEQNLTQSDFHGPNKEFLKNLFEARTAILKSPQVEEEFCLADSYEELSDTEF